MCARDECVDLGRRHARDAAQSALAPYRPKRFETASAAYDLDRFVDRTGVYRQQYGDWAPVGGQQGLFAGRNLLRMRPQVSNGDGLHNEIVSEGGRSIGRHRVTRRDQPHAGPPKVADPRGARRRRLWAAAVNRSLTILPQQRHHPVRPFPGLVAASREGAGGPARPGAGEEGHSTSGCASSPSAHPTTPAGANGGHRGRSVSPLSSWAAVHRQPEKRRVASAPPAGERRRAAGLAVGRRFRRVRGGLQGCPPRGRPQGISTAERGGAWPPRRRNRRAATATAGGGSRLAPTGRPPRGAGGAAVVSPFLVVISNGTWLTAHLKVQGGRQADATKDPADFLPHGGGSRTREGMAATAG